MLLFTHIRFVEHVLACVPAIACIKWIRLNNSWEAFNAVFDKHAPYEEIKEYTLKLKTKPWRTAGIHNSI